MQSAIGKVATNCMRLWCSDTIGMCVQMCRVASVEPHTARTMTERGAGGHRRQVGLPATGVDGPHQHHSVEHVEEGVVVELGQDVAVRAAAVAAREAAGDVRLGRAAHRRRDGSQVPLGGLGHGHAHVSSSDDCTRR